MLFWMVLVERTWSVCRCNDCGLRQDVLRYQVVRLSVHRQTLEQKGIVQRLAEDLGKPCGHLHTTEYVKQRWWGTCLVRIPLH